jgi:hypothetical protein
MQIRLTRKVAQVLDGVDVSAHCEGDVFTLPVREAELLIKEGWAVQHRATARAGAGALRRALATSTDQPGGKRQDTSQAADNSGRRPPAGELLGKIREALEHCHVQETEKRRAEDRIREDLRDSKAKTVTKAR